VRYFFLLLCFSSSLFIATSYAQEKTPQKQPAQKDTSASKKAADNATSDKNSDAAKKSETPEKKADKLNTPEIKINLPPDLQNQFKNDIKHFTNTKNIKPMLAGSEDIITLLNEETSGNPRGVAILLPNWQQPLVSSKAINYLSNTLPSKGWTTITIQSPKMPKNYPSKKMNLLEREEENQETLNQYQKKLSVIIKKVLEKAMNYPGIFLVVAEGSNAAILVNLYAQQTDIQPDALVLLSPHLLNQSDNQFFANNLASIAVPALDLYLSRDNKLVSANAPMRKAKSKKMLKVFYRQQQFNNVISGAYPLSDLLKAINGWLKNIGW